MVERNWIKSNGYFGEGSITSKEHKQQFSIISFLFLNDIWFSRKKEIELIKIFRWKFYHREGQRVEVSMFSFISDDFVLFMKEKDKVESNASFKFYGTRNEGPVNPRRSFNKFLRRPSLW